MSSAEVLRTNFNPENTRNVTQTCPSKERARSVLQDFNTATSALPYKSGTAGDCDEIVDSNCKKKRTLTASNKLVTWREDCLNRLTSSVDTVPTVVRELATIVGNLGFEYCSYVFSLPQPFPKPTVTWCSTYPDRWLNRYFSHDYLDIDPLLKRVAQDVMPVVWSDEIFKSQPAFWEEARAHGVKHGWALATHGNRSSTGTLSLARSGENLTTLELDRNESRLVWLSHVTHGLISTIQMESVQRRADKELTSREREVLRWTAAGKTADEIGKILAIAERTVTFHIASCLVKLDAVNKTQAVVKAALSDMLF